MRFFLKNLQMMLQPKVLTVVCVCFITSVLYNGPRFPETLCGIRGGFELLSAVSWTALIFPYFFATGAFFASMEDAALFALPRSGNIRRYIVICGLCLLTFSVSYCLLGALAAVLCGGELAETLLCAALLTVNLLFLAIVQGTVYAANKNLGLSIGIVLGILILALLFPHMPVNPGAWGMLARSRLRYQMGFPILPVLGAETVLTLLGLILTVQIQKKKLIL